MSRQSKKKFLVREISTSCMYTKPNPEHGVGTKTESAGLQLSVSVLTVEKDPLKLKLAKKDAEIK